MKINDGYIITAIVSTALIVTMLMFYVKTSDESRKESLYRECMAGTTVDNPRYAELVMACTDYAKRMGGGG
ncbi:hypothetical protein M8812_002272 [Salmonella enterica subsp. enterica serovar Bareilly]|jgi:hypothetical protein|nr:hypothetical protein [Salmonella enterica subsp. enterica serovar Bareilly]MLM11403.1 hypothetical protein [Salmonella enterica subsp. enterica serovar Bareilly]